MPAITKDLISPPLEAGPSLLDTNQLPPQLCSALDYVSTRLARKRLHITLVAMRKDVQLPTSPPPSPPLPAPKSRFEPFTRSLSKHSSSLSLKSSSSATSSNSKESLRITAPAPTSPTLTTTISYSRTQHPSLPSSPRPISPTSTTSSESSSPSLSPCSSPIMPNSYGISLLHATSLTPKAEKILRSIVAKAEKKFDIGSAWLSAQPLTTSSRCAMTNDLIRRSITQNEIIFCSEGLTLLSLCHIYTFKCYLHNYSRLLTPAALTAGVDELQRLVLAHHGRRITKGYLIRTYSWLGVSLSALVDVNEGYKKSYGGIERLSGIEISNEERHSPPPLKTEFGRLAPPPPRRPALQLAYLDTRREVVEVGESAKGRDITLSPAASLSSHHTSVSYNQDSVTKKFYNDLTSFREDRGPHLRGPVTPNDYGDITPITKGEWKFLIVGDGFGTKTGPLEVC
ncbi:hypothetical protein BP5796_10136 [Coleophoma crateriformis]|uniref:DUF7582 domain-containing protein n=1 Tax=Coleophoma crateriformis TaxID=565419 RepID=A0A3D8QVB1_9HELO|nr:hypothetical protein BP5796_10136 [Coleophoma crateriformis]